MLKKRVIACLPVLNGVVVQSFGFARYLPVGKLPVAVEFLNQWGIDEIIVVDIGATKDGQQPNFEQIKHASARCLVPLAVGGGIRDLTDVDELLHSGADKVVVNRALFEKPDLIRKIAKAYGDQCVVVSIDAVPDNNEYKAFNYASSTAEKTTVVEASRKAVALGAGELFINSVARDGSYKGYDLSLVSQVCEAVSVPVIACGGAKNADDFNILFTETEAAAGCASNFFHFTEHSVITTKQLLTRKRSDIRFDSHASYANTSFDTNYRILPKPEEELQRLLFVRIEKEAI